MTRLVITPQAGELGLYAAQAWLLEGLQAPLRADAFAPSVFEEVEEQLRSQSLPEDDGYRRLLSGLGHSGTIPAGENLRRLALERGLRSYGLLIDAVNLTTLRYGGGIGLHDVSELPLDKWDLVVTRAAGTERMQPSFTSRSRPIPAGDLIYGSELHGETELSLFAWLGAKDRDAEQYQITEETTSACLVVLGHGGTDDADNERVGCEVINRLAEHESGMRLRRLHRHRT